MTDRDETRRAVADALHAAWEARQPCAQPSQTFAGLDVADAYAIQQLNVARRLERGMYGEPTRVVGRKIGLTSEAIQSWLGVDTPDFGTLLDDMAVPDGGTAEIDVLLQPRAEAEVAFVLGEDLAGPGVTAADVLRATAFVLPAIEIVDSCVADWEITFVDTVADNASSGMFVLGNDPTPLDDLALRTAGMALSKNGHVVSTGAGAACLGHPVNAVVWLADVFGEMGEVLQAGEVLLSGALGPVTEVNDGDVVEARIAGLGNVSCRFASSREG